MTENQKKVLELIKSKSDINTIKQKLKLTDRSLIQILNTLKSRGYSIRDDFNFSGIHKVGLGFCSTSDKIKIKGEKDESASCIVISDTHISPKYTDKRALSLVYDYAVKKKIPYILHTGDLVHDHWNSQNEFENSIYDLIREYPKDSSVTTFFIQGNHDTSSMERYGMNIGNMISSARLDLIPIGIDEGTIMFNNAIIKLYHQKNPPKPNNDNVLEDDSDLILRGHQHIYQLSSYTNKKQRLGLMIQTPCLSKMKMRSHTGVVEKGFVQLDLNYSKNKTLSDAIVQQYTITDKIIKAGELNYQFKKVR